MRHNWYWIFPVLFITVLLALVETTCKHTKQHRKLATDTIQKATDDWNQFVAITNSRATNEANWHTNNMPNHNVGVFFDFSGMRTITNNVAVKEYGIVFGELVDGDIAPKYLSIVLSCGNGLVFGPGVTIPTNDVPCPCGNTNHWLWKFRNL